MADTTRDIHLHNQQTLYRHWEEQQWSPWDIDLATDRRHWGAMSGDDRSLIFWALSSLMVAEERITTKFAGSPQPTSGWWPTRATRARRSPS